MYIIKIYVRDNSVNFLPKKKSLKIFDKILQKKKYY